MGNPHPFGNATAGMSGAGVYNHNSSMQREVVDRAAVRLAASVDGIGAVTPEFTAVDYGCGPGRNSAAAFRTVIEAYRRHSPAGVVVAVHNDQLGNDWSDLFATVSGPDGYLDCPGPIRCQAVAGSFFEPVAAPGSVDLGMSFSAVQWLRSAIELPSPGTLFFTELEEGPRQALAAVADRDWTHFLRQRAAELRPGGRLLVQMLGAVADPRAPGGSDTGVGGLYRLMWEVASDLAEAGRLDGARLDRFVWPQWFRTPDEARAPMEREPDLAGAFRIEELGVEPVAFPFAAEYVRSGDAERYAADYTAFVRSFTEGTLREQLFVPSTGSAAAAAELNAEYYARLKERFDASPGAHDYAVQSLVVLLARV